MRIERVASSDWCVRIGIVLSACAWLGACGGSSTSAKDGAADASHDQLTFPEGQLDGLIPDGRVASLPAGSTVSGIVVSTADSSPVVGARVAFGGQLEGVQTDAQGRFTLTTQVETNLFIVALTAGHEDFYSGGVAVYVPTAAQRIALDPFKVVDDPSYEYKGAKTDKDVTPYCWHCHQPQVAPFLASTHASAARNPKLLDLYNGTISGISDASACAAAGGLWRRGQAPGETTAQDKCYLVTVASVLADLNPGVCGAAGQAACDDPSAPAAQRPTNAGPCADCHAAPTAAHAPGATNLNSIRGLIYKEGLTCDFCHKIDKVTANDAPGINGAITLRRPENPGPNGWGKPEIMFGPLTDVPMPIMGNIYRPQYRQSSYCSACHQWRARGIRPGDAALIDSAKWPDGLPIQDTYREWQGRPAWMPESWTCQSCHMPADDVETAAFPLGQMETTTGGAMGWRRPFGQVRSHAFLARQPALAPGAKEMANEPSRALLRKPIDVTVDAQRQGGELVVNVSLQNRGAGHSLPTGTPSRQLLLLVSASSQGTALQASGGVSIPEWTGTPLAATLASGGTAANTAQLTGTTLTLLDGRTFPAASVGQRVRFVAATGPWADYPGTDWFGDAARTPAEKGMPLLAPLGEATITAVNGSSATLDRALTIAVGSRLMLGAPAPTGTLTEDQELPTAALAGAAGWVFSKLLRDRDGSIAAPFFRAVDVVSDNRIPAGATAKTEHRFDSSAVTTPIDVVVTLLYRRYPWDRAQRRGWTVVDVVRQQKFSTVP